MSQLKFTIYFALTTLFWGGSFLGIHYAIQGFTTHFAVFLRILVAFVFLAPILLLRKQKLKNIHWKQGMAIGLMGIGIPWMLLFWGEQHIAPALAAVLNSTVPIFVTILTPLITPKDKNTWQKWVGVLVGFFGVGLIFYPKLSIWELNHYILGLLAIVLMSVSYAISILWTRRLGDKMPSSNLLYYQLIGAGLLMIAVNAYAGSPFVLPALSYKALLAILYLGIFSTAIAILLFIKMIKGVGSVQASAVTYLIPLVSILLDLIVLGKVLLINQAIGACLILAAIFLINRK